MYCRIPICAAQITYQWWSLWVGVWHAAYGLRTPVTHDYILQDFARNIFCIPPIAGHWALGSKRPTTDNETHSRPGNSDKTLPVDEPCLWKGNATLELLTMEEVAKMTRLPIATLRWYRATGKGGPKSGKVGGRRVMYLRSDVERWIQSAFEEGAA
jgi:predicted DNA-binding transcriptional regulator AlpA